MISLDVDVSDFQISQENFVFGEDTHRPWAQFNFSFNVNAIASHSHVNSFLWHVVLFEDDSPDSRVIANLSSDNSNISIDVDMLTGTRTIERFGTVSGGVLDGNYYVGVLAYAPEPTESGSETVLQDSEFVSVRLTGHPDAVIEDYNQVRQSFTQDTSVFTDAETHSGDDEINSFSFSSRNVNSIRDISIESSNTEVFFNPDDKVVLSDIERLDFSNGTLAIDIDGHAGQVYRLYQAAFDRTPDRVGLGHNINLLDSDLTLAQMAAGFIEGAEFQLLYGSSSSDTEFVTALYNNVLDRSPDAGGLAGWQQRLQAGLWDRPEVLIGFSESAENIEKVSPAIEDGIWL